jgi:hypothetical protein
MYGSAVAGQQRKSEAFFGLDIVSRRLAVVAVANASFSEERI